jgi:hypothetical protein
MTARLWRALVTLIVSIASIPIARTSAAQQPARASQSFHIPPYPELRVDAITGKGTTAQAGAGIVVPLGLYVRLALDGAAGATWRDGSSRASGRVDAITRFTLDPFRESPVALSLGGGITLPYVDGDAHLRPLLAAVVDLEGRRRGRFTPALQVGLGGGVRIGLVLRASPRNAR